MALRLQTFRTRTITAIVFVVIMLGGLLLSPWSFLLLFSVIHIGCWIDYQKLAGLIDTDYSNISTFHRYGVILAGFGFMLWMTNDVYSIGSVKLSELGWFLMMVVLIALPINEILLSRQFKLKIIFTSLAGLLYISLSCGLMIGLRSEGMIFGSLFSLDLGLILPLLLIGTIWINDTMAYIVGSLVGKTPFSSISPKKTWEGTIGGAVLAIAGITALAFRLFQADVTQVIFVTAIACVSGILGDLLESKMKRRAGVKDSGNIMPGHGGFLDRFDSLLVATIFVWIYVKLFM
jgi:phosphatidate cytidylyltransferase